MRKIIYFYFLFSLVFPQKLKYPNFQKNILPNGLTVYTAEHREQPVVFFNLLIPVGEFDLSNGKKGLASLATEMFSKGTQNYSADELSEAIEFTGGSITTSGGDEYTTFTGRFLKEDLIEYIEPLN